MFVIPTNIPRFASNELSLSTRLGQGGFCDVHLIHSFNLKSDEKETVKNEVENEMKEEKLKSVVGGEDELEQDEQRNVLAKSKASFVMKRIRKDLSEANAELALSDLSIEISILSKLYHDNIISLRACSKGNPSKTGFFVILNRLTETLEHRIDFKWKKERSNSTGIFGCCKAPGILHELWMERMFVAHDIANALQYLHEKSIVYRDLKPENIGFDMEGIVKIFDFGLAKDLNTATKCDGMYEMTGNTGTIWYMAPEVYLGLLYDERVDIYSFGILLWQICSLANHPFHGYSREMHGSLIVGKGARPAMNPDLEPSIKKLIETCWDADIEVRPRVSTILKVIDLEISEKHGSMRRSFFDFSLSRLSVDLSIRSSQHDPIGKRHNVPVL